MPSNVYVVQVGGFTIGMVIGILVVENLHLSDCEKYFILPMSYITGGLIVLWGLYNYATHFPPEAQVWDAPYDTCCYQVPVTCSRTVYDTCYRDETYTVCRLPVLGKRLFPF